MTPHTIDFFARLMASCWRNTDERSKIALHDPSASDWLLLNQMRMPRAADEVAGKSLSILTGIAAMPVLVMAHFTTNPALDYVVQLDAGYTNPNIAVGVDTPAGWTEVEEAEVQLFLSFIDEQIIVVPDF